MKKLSLVAFAAGMLLCACSEKEIVQQPVNPENFKDGAYIGISLTLPTAEGTTRANDDLSNGTEDEFNVKNATLYIFKVATGGSEKDATYVDNIVMFSSFENDQEGGIDPSDEWGIQTGVDATNITSTNTGVTRIDNTLAASIKSDTGNDYYVYVVLNHNGLMPACTSATTFEAFSKTQFNVIGADIAAEKNIGAGGLLMTSAPICDKSGGSAAPASGAKYTTLVALNKNKIHGSAAEAKNDPAACVYVERAAVKITVEDGRSTTTIGSGSSAKELTINGWQVINYEPSFYNTRQVVDTWGDLATDQTGVNPNTLYRFVTLNAFAPQVPSAAGHTTGFRTYFAQDVQYDADATLSKPVAPVAGPWIALNKHAYTTENTFDVEHQTWKNTTMVTVKATLAGGGFYTVGKGNQDMYTKTAAEAAIEKIVISDPTVAAASTALLNKIAANNPTATVVADLTVTITEPSAGTTGVTFTITPAFTINGSPADYTGTDETTLKTALETAISDFSTGTTTKDYVLVSYYKDGEMYYNARIKHFGDYETPWSATGNYISGLGTTISEIYGPGSTTAEQTLRNRRFLGRYGVVRDNWYKLSIDKIGKIGEAEPVNPSVVTPDTPDDEIENYISVHVHIVPWVLRSQSVEF